MIEAAEADVIRPAVAAERPYRPLDEVVYKGKQQFRRGLGVVFEGSFQLVNIFALFFNGGVIGLSVGKQLVDNGGGNAFALCFGGNFAGVNGELVAGKTEAQRKFGGVLKEAV